MPDTSIKIIEVGPRDGLQRETTFIPTKDKIAMVHRLVDAGIKRIQVTSFVHPTIVSQMADAEAVCAGLDRREDVQYSGLVLNMKGLERAHASGLTHVDMSISASDSHGRKNANMGLEEAINHFAEMVERAHSLGITVRGGVQCAFGYYEDDVTQAIVIDLLRRHLALGVASLAIADSTGMANPVQIRTMLREVMPLAGRTPIVLHLHDTRGMGLANVLAGIEAGCTHFDTAFGGLGGCNFIDGASGNIATEDTINMLHDIGYATGIDNAKVSAVSQFLAEKLGHALPGKLYQLLT